MDTAKCKLWLKTLLYFVTLTVGYTVLGDSSNDERFTRMHYGLAQGTYQIGDFAGALESLSILLQRHPEHLAALQLKVQTLWQLGRDQEAEQTLKTALRIQPDSELNAKLQRNLLRTRQSQSLYERVRLLAKNESFEQALTELEKHMDWLLTDPQLAELCLSLYLRQENWLALTQFFHKLPVNIVDPAYQAYLLGRIQLNKGDLSAARTHFENARQKTPAASLHHSILFYLAFCNIQDPTSDDDGYPKVIEAIDVGFRPETLSEFQTVSTSLLRQHKPARALALLESALNRRVAKNALFWLILSRVQLANKNPERAISASNQAITLQVNLAQAYIARARAHQSRKDFEQAKQDYQQALSIQPQRLDIVYALAINCMYSGEIEAAYRALQRASQTQQASEFWLIFAVLANANGQLSVAQSALAHYKSLQTNDRSTSADYLSSLLHQNTENAAEPLTKNSSDHSYFQQFHHGQLSAVALLDQHLQSQSESNFSAQQTCALFYWMAQSYQARKQTSEALNFFKKAVKSGKPDWIEWHLAQWQLQQCERSTAP